MNENRCDKCGAQLQQNTSICNYCGNKVVLDNNFYNDQETTSYEMDQPKNLKRGKIFRTIISVISITIAIVSTFGEFAGKYMVNKFSEKEQINEINAYIERMEDYVPGRSTKNKYVSEHFGFQFKTDENWIMYSDEELEPYTEELKQATISGGMASIESYDISQELKDKLMSSVYFDIEMGAYYVDDDMLVGEAIVIVYSAYGAEEASADKLVDRMKSKASTTTDNVISGKKVIAGDMYDTIKTTVTIDDMIISNEIFVRIQDNMICMIGCKTLEGYEDDVTESFFNQISKYK